VQTCALPIYEQGKTAMIVGVDGVPQGVVAVADEVRPEARPAVEALHEAGVKVVMATGDAEPVARNVAAELGIDEFHAGMLPETKVDVVRGLQSEGHTVAMLGDGVNDMPRWPPPRSAWRWARQGRRRPSRPRISS